LKVFQLLPIKILIYIFAGELSGRSFMFNAVLLSQVKDYAHPVFDQRITV